MSNHQIARFSFASSLAFLLGGLIADLGEDYPAYTIHWGMVFVAIAMMGGSFFLGYCSRKPDGSGDE